MNYYSFETETFDCDYETEDFGLAKSFSNAPLLQIAPLSTFNNTHEDSVEKEIESTSVNEIRADGFCFKLCPTAD